MALENATAGQAWAAVRARFTREKGEFLLYSVLRVFMPLFAFVVIIVALMIPCIIVFGALALVMFGLHSVLGQAVGAVWFLYLLLQWIVGLVVATLAILIAISFFGPVCIAVRNYALVFYGGRYQALGDALWPPLPSPPPAAAGIEPGVA
jgi:hypothetical protein